MAPRAKVAMSGDDLDRSYPESSPDPLAGSITENRAKQKRKTTRTSSQPLASSSPSKQNRRVSITDTEFSSPSKAMVLNTPRTAGASPWRIKVTVEAEPGSDDENLESPSVKRVTRTKTTTVPLKDADAPSPVKRRGRPRKSDTTAAKPKRNGTPVKRKAKSKPRSSSVGADASAADVDTDAAPKKRRGRPRKSIQPPTEDEETLVVEELTQQDISAFVAEPEPEEELQTEPEAGVEDNIATPEPTQVLIPVIETTLATPLELQAKTSKTPPLDGTSLLPPVDKKKPELIKEVEEPIRFTPPQTELSQRLRARKGTPHAKGKLPVYISSDEESDEVDDINTPSGTDEEVPRVGTVVQEEQFESVDAPVPGHEDEEDEIQDVTNFAFEEGATRMPDDPTIVESENFSMISVDSLPSSGGLTSPVVGPTSRTPIAPSPASSQKMKWLKIPPTLSPHVGGSPRTSSKSSPGVSRAAVSIAPIRSSPPRAPPRYKTPSMEPTSPADPPAIELPRMSPSEAKTPKIGRVVKAGVALQGVLDPARETPEAGLSKTVDQRRDDLDDLFRGFSERTRRELQAGLRLGEQLSQHSQSNTQSSPALSSPIKAKAFVEPAEDVFAPQAKRTSRLLTPEDQDDYNIPSPVVALPSDIQYPSLSGGNEESRLLSPANSPERDEDEMSWRVDTPPVQANNANGRCCPTINNGLGGRAHGKGMPAITNREKQEKEDYSDIWQEEASRSSTSLEDDGAIPDKTPQLEDLFAQDGPVKPARGKLPRTWRRKSSGDFQYSDEAEESQEPTPPSTESDESPPQRSHKSTENYREKNAVGALDTPVELQDEDSDLSEGSDDTGMFFQSNIPSLFNKKRSTELRQKKTEKRNLSLLMNEGESLLLDSSPPVPISKTPVNDKPNPFLNTPPRFAAIRSSPVKSSPLRQEIRASETSSESIQQGFEESTLPLPPSSPFHTYVEGDTAFTTASDQRQFQQEMAAATSTDSSLRRISNEADDYLDAYEPQERSLGEIEEVTEPSRSYNKETTMIPATSSPVKQTFEESMLNPKRVYAPLFGTESVSTVSASAKEVRIPEGVERIAIAKKPIVAVAASEEEQPAQPSSGIFGRLTSTLWSALGNSPSPLIHPVLESFDRLPKVEPWTKTHYKTLDALYQRHRKQPSLFSPSGSSNTNTNDALLAHFARSTNLPFIGAKYSAWGYSVTIDESLGVLCAVYMQLLTLKDVREYEMQAGKPIQMGDCNPGVSGATIEEEQVVKRLATVIMGEQLRKDEKKGKTIDRSGALTVEWPQ